MTQHPAQAPEDDTHPRLPRYSPSYHHNIRAMPQISELHRDKFGPLPLITLSGAWLRTFGFTVGLQVRIEATPDQIILRPIWTGEPGAATANATQEPTVRYTDVADR
ncbi:SymE family type I addiction module toxin [Stenotrophomonas sp. NPDC077464]|uniref:SymE family type I addiction module toxin n=1 Tax=unclassified Stenotrophomonas TaxID=196198 RepID=UPI0037D47F64